MRWRARSLLWRTGQLLLTLLPALLMASAGLMYLWQVKLAVEDSLPPALQEYARRQAQLEVQLERVSLRWSGILLTRPEIRTLSGERLLRARYLEARLPAHNAPLTIEIDRPEVWIQRDHRGRWNIDPLLRRPRPPEPTPLTLRVVAREGALYFDDFFPRQPVRATVWADEFAYTQPRIGASITARGVGDALGAFTVHALSDGERWLVELNADRVQATRFKPYLPDIEFDLQRATAQLSAQLIYAPNQPLQVQGAAQGTVEQPTYRQKPLPWRMAQVRVAFTESSLVGEMRTPQGELDAQFSVDWSGKSVALAGAGRVRGSDAATLWRLLRTDKPLVAGGYTMQLRFEGSPQSLKLIGAATLERAHTPQGEVRNLRSPLLFADGQLYLPALQVEYAGRPVKGKLWLDTRPKSPAFRLYAAISDLPLSRIPALREQKLRGAVDTALIAYGSLEQPVVEANLLSDALFYEGRRLGGARARVRYADGALQIPLAVLQGAAGLAQITGEIKDARTDNPRFELSLEATELDLNLLAQLLGYTENGLRADGADKPLRLDGVGYLTAQLRGSL
ncbi:MAG: hypothetical protein NZ556_01460, partial [Fimbriimonadales bacterium]|nr:hypothetical protein [Fimbriimonadales bacterium]